MSYGLCGGHRTGKTTLAKMISETSGLPLVITSTSAVFKEHGFDPSLEIGLNDRIFIQNKVLDSAIKLWDSQAGAFVTDRTPLDMIAYMMGEIHGGLPVNVKTSLEIERYVTRCFEAANRYFNVVVLVQPGIEMVGDETKLTAAMNAAYVEHLNTLILGVMTDTRFKGKAYAIPRRILDVRERLSYCFARLSSFVETLKKEQEQFSIH